MRKKHNENTEKIVEILIIYKSISLILFWRKKASSKDYIVRPPVRYHSELVKRILLLGPLILILAILYYLTASHDYGLVEGLSV